MNNEEKLRNIFAEVLGIEEKQVINDLTYNSIPEWDSIAHMALISEIDDQFDTMLDTDDVLEMSTFAKAKNILGKYEVKF
ncbi:acyl carrier protein [Lysinibacillus sp. NPDC093210]|uniref:acyl carrier protein n=1 Tax=Lysinibacillus sp. NPDC093210 TaxID=3364133 RepID=UPI00381AF4F3